MELVVSTPVCTVTSKCKELVPAWAQNLTRFRQFRAPAPYVLPAATLMMRLHDTRSDRERGRRVDPSPPANRNYRRWFTAPALAVDHHASRALGIGVTALGAAGIAVLTTSRSIRHLPALKELG